MKMSLCKLEVKDMVNILDWGYDKALNGLPGMGTAEELARDYLTANCQAKCNFLE